MRQDPTGRVARPTTHGPGWIAAQGKASRLGPEPDHVGAPSEAGIRAHPRKPVGDGLGGNAKLLRSLVGSRARQKLNKGQMTVMVANLKGRNLQVDGGLLLHDGIIHPKQR